MRIETLIRLMAAMTTVIGGLIAFYYYTGSTALSIMFGAILLSLALHGVQLSSMATKEDLAALEARVSRIESSMATKEDISRLWGAVRSVVMYYLGTQSMLVDFLALRGVIMEADARFLKGSFEAQANVVIRLMNPLRLTEEEKEAMKRIIKLPLEEISERDCDIVYEALVREVLEGSLEAARLLPTLMWLRAYIKYGRKGRKEREKGQQNRA